MNRFTQTFSRVGGVFRPVHALKPAFSMAVTSHQSVYFGNTSQTSSSIKLVSKAVLIDMLRKPDFVLLDVRRADEVEWGMIPTAVHIPLDQLYRALKLDNEEFKLEYGFPKPLKEKKLVFYCQSGIRSNSACELAAAMGYKDVSNYKGSWNEWSSN